MKTKRKKNGPYIFFFYYSWIRPQMEKGAVRYVNAPDDSLWGYLLILQGLLIKSDQTTSTLMKQIIS